MRAKKILIWIVLTCVPAVFFGCAGIKSAASHSAGCGILRVRVLDGFTDEPIEGASVTVPELGRSFPTGADGLTEGIETPVIPDGEYDRLLPSASGRATLIVRAEGYTPCLLLYVRVTPGLTRAPTVRMFPADGSLPVFTTIEAPDEEWCRALVDKYS